MGRRNKPVSITACEDPFTKIPNHYFERIMRQTSAEMKVCMVVTRKTIGWHKEWDVISFSQFRELTGMNNTSIKLGIEGSIATGLIDREQKGKSFRYRVSNQYRSGTDRSANVYRSGTDTSTDLVHTKETKETAPRASASAELTKESDRPLKSYTDQRLRAAYAAAREARDFDGMYELEFEFCERGITL